MGQKNNKKRKEYKKEVPLYKGVFEITRSGMGFVIVSGLEKDIIIRPNDFNRAFHGDQVRVEITKGDLRAGRLQGRITQVIERKQKQFVGIVEVNKDFFLLKIAKYLAAISNALKIFVKAYFLKNQLEILTFGLRISL